LSVVHWDHQGEVPMREAQLEIGSGFPEYLAFYKVFDNGCSMVRIDDLVPFGEHSTPSWLVASG
jgi:hypothetical protein